jgi:metal-responsive CopG/Arc/MetJ family transcriptional regulator
MEHGMTAAKIAISLPREVLASVEEACRGQGQSRSEFILHAVRAYLDTRIAEAEAAAYARGYERFPETPEEIAEIDRMGAAVLALEPWD